MRSQNGLERHRVAEMNLVAMQNKNAIPHIFAKMKSLITWIRLVGEDEETMTKSRFKKMRTNHDEASYVSCILPATGKSLPSGRRVRPQTKRGLEQYSGRLKAVGVVKAKTEP